MRRIVKWTAVLCAGLIVLCLLAGLALYPVGMEKLSRTYPRTPVEAVAVPTGADVVSYGKQVAIARACDECHGAGLSGKVLADYPIVGTIPASNLTPGNGGVGNSYSDADWIRAIRHNVRPDGRAIGFMYDYSKMSDRDLGALIAYLKQLPPVDSGYPAVRIGPVAAVASGLGLFSQQSK